MRQESRLEPLRLLDELLVDRRRRAFHPSPAELVRRVADDHVELHVVSKQLGDPSLDVVGVDERIGVGFEAFATVIELPLAGAAVTCTCRPPQVCSMRSNQMLPSSLANDLAMECLPVGVLRAVHAPPREQAGEMRDADAEHLLGQDVIDALLEVRESRPPSPR